MWSMTQVGWVVRVSWARVVIRVARASSLGGQVAVERLLGACARGVRCGVRSLRSFEFVSMRFVLGRRRGAGGELAEVVAAGFELEDRIVCRLLGGRVRRGVRSSRARAAGRAGGVVRGRRAPRRVARLGQWASGSWVAMSWVTCSSSTRCGQLAMIQSRRVVLDGHRGGEVLVHLDGVELRGDDAVDELALVGGRCGEELLQFVLAVDELGRRRDSAAARRRVWGGRRARGGLRGSQHQVLPPVGRRRVVGSGADAGLVVGDVVEESVVGDAGGGVVPD